MNYNYNGIDIESMRKDLEEEFTAAMFLASPVALADLTQVENAPDEEVLKIAKENKYDFSKYRKR